MLGSPPATPAPRPRPVEIPPLANLSALVSYRAPPPALTNYQPSPTPSSISSPPSSNPSEMSTASTVLPNQFQRSPLKSASTSHGLNLRPFIPAGPTKTQIVHYSTNTALAQPPNHAKSKALPTPQPDANNNTTVSTPSTNSNSTASGSQKTTTISKSRSPTIILEIKTGTIKMADKPSTPSHLLDPAGKRIIRSASFQMKGPTGRFNETLTTGRMSARTSNAKPKPSKPDENRPSIASSNKKPIGSSRPSTPSIPAPSSTAAAEMNDLCVYGTELGQQKPNVQHRRSQLLNSLIRPSRPSTPSFTRTQPTTPSILSSARSTASKISQIAHSIRPSTPITLLNSHNQQDSLETSTYVKSQQKSVPSIPNSTNDVVNTSNRTFDSPISSRLSSLYPRTSTKSSFTNSPTTAKGTSSAAANPSEIDPLHDLIKNSPTMAFEVIFSDLDIEKSEEEVEEVNVSEAADEEDEEVISDPSTPKEKSDDAKFNSFINRFTIDTGLREDPKRRHSNSDNVSKKQSKGWEEELEILLTETKAVTVSNYADALLGDKVNGRKKAIIEETKEMEEEDADFALNPMNAPRNLPERISRRKNHQRIDTSQDDVNEDFEL